MSHYDGVATDNGDLHHFAIVFYLALIDVGPLVVLLCLVVNGAPGQILELVRKRADLEEEQEEESRLEIIILIITV